MDVAEALVEHIIDTDYKDIPESVVQATKHHILHTLTTIIGGSNTAGCEAVANVLKEWGGNEESTVLVYGGRLPAIHAAMANAVMAHALDYCANDDRTHYKCSVVVVPVSLAMAEREKATGQQFLAAVCLGVETGIRIAQAIRPRPAHALSWLIGCFASAAAAGKLLKLGKEQMLDALGIAYCQVAPAGYGIASIRHPSLNKRLGPGLAARAGVFAAQLAQKGFRSGRNVLQGPSGYFHTFYGQEGDLQEINANLGSRFEIDNVGPKGYPSCRETHAPIDGTLALVQEHNIKPNDVDSVSVFLSEQNLLAQSEATPESAAKARRPQGHTDAIFSISYTVATAIVKREVFIGDFADDALRNPEVLGMVDRVRIMTDSGLGRSDTCLSPVRVEIKTKNGAVYQQRVDFPKGNPHNPVSFEETKRNLVKCVPFAARSLPLDRVQRAIDTVGGLEKVTNVAHLSELLCGGVG